jgi:TetR/AcrR family transcriptional repressor of nem operon
VGPAESRPVAVIGPGAGSAPIFRGGGGCYGRGPLRGRGSEGAFYHYFGSKDAFGEAVMKAYFADYLADMDLVLGEPGTTSAKLLMNYRRNRREPQSVDECQGKCLAVKLGAEVADLSESMRIALKEDTTAIIDRLERTIADGLEDGSIVVDGAPRDTAQVLYDMWLGASVMAKIHRDIGPLDTTTRVTRRLLNL